LFAIPLAKAQRTQRTRREDGRGEELLFDKFSLNKINQESITIIKRIKPLFFPFASFTPPRLYEKKWE
jgi:hypothetical protein